MRVPAIVFVDTETVQLRQIEMPPPGPGEVQIRTRFSTVSTGTETWIWTNRFTWSPTHYPCVPGYQRTGTITALGGDVTGWRVGDQAVATVGRWAGQPVPSSGAHTALANTPAAELYRMPEGVSLSEASACVVAQVGYNAAGRVVMEPGDWVLVYGDGIIGQCGAQAAHARGARVIVVGHRAERLQIAEQCGAEAAINGHDGDVAAAVREHTRGLPVTAVIDTVQTLESQAEYIGLLEHGKGQIVYSGFTPGETWADMGLLQRRELTTHFVAGWTRQRMEATLSLMSEGGMRVGPLVTHRVSYARGPDMYQMTRRKSEPFLGITFDWREAL